LFAGLFDFAAELFGCLQLVLQPLDMQGQLVWVGWYSERSGLH
jgi:hypothetical protein